MSNFRGVYRDLRKGGDCVLSHKRVQRFSEGEGVCLTSEACTEILERAGIVYSHISVNSVLPKEREDV